MIDTNLTAAFRLTRGALRPMISARFGRVVNIASVVGPRANAGQANYAAAKAGLIGMTKTVAAEVARRGVTVNAVAPGFIATDMTEDLPDAVMEAVPARRAGTPEEVAACVRFLASDDAGYVTGTTLSSTAACPPDHPNRNQGENHMTTTTTPEAVEQTVFEALPQFGAEESEITRDATFEELDVDSLDLAELAQIVEDEYGVQLKGDDVAQDQDRRRRRRPGGEPSRMNREVVVTGVGAVTPLGVGARTLHERWRAGESGIEDGVGRCAEFDPTEHLLQEGGAPRRPLHAVRARRRRRGARRGRLGRRSCRTTPTASAASSAPASAASGRSSTTTRPLLEKGAERGLAARRPADDGQRRRRRRGDAPRAARPVLRDRLGLRRGRARDRRRAADDPGRRRRRRRRRRLGGGAHAARQRRVRGARRAVGRRASRARSTPAATAS